MRRVVVLVHPLDSLDLRKAFLGPILDCWREEGIDVRVVNDPIAEVDADLAVLHIDATITPEDCLRFGKRYPRTINGAVKDISKRAISSRLVDRDSDYAGPVIVKTNLNCGGAPEYRLAHSRSAGLLAGLTRLPRLVRANLPWQWRTSLDSKRYPVFESIDAVPRAVWDNPHLVVEQFTPEIRDGKYCLRTWCFLGDRETHSISYSDKPVVKLANVQRREMLAEVPESLRDLRRQWGFDFGKFDYVMVDGEAILFDANGTPTFGSATAGLADGLRTLARGIDAFLPAATGGSGHWSQAARLWQHVGAPLRPCAEDTEFLARHMRSWSEQNGAPRALILGVTPEIYRLPWPAGSDVKAVDHNTAMIDAIWPGPRGDVVSADWTDIPVEDASRDLVFCDGGIHLLRYPDQQQALVNSLRRIVAPGGLCLFRLFTPPPDRREMPEQVLDDLLSGSVPDLNILKLRLWAALQDTPQEGVGLEAVWQAVHDMEPNLNALADRLGWAQDHLQAIDTYRGSQARYHLLSLDEVCELFCAEGGFRVEDRYTPSYLLGERCPTLILRRLVDGKVASHDDSLHG